MGRGGAREGGGRKPKPEGEKAVTMAIAIAPDLRDELKAEAARRGISVSQLAQAYILRGLRVEKREREDLDAALEDTADLAD